MNSRFSLEIDFDFKNYFPTLFSELMTLQNLSFELRNEDVPRSRVKFAIKKVFLSHLTSRRLLKFSAKRVLTNKLDVILQKTQTELNQNSKNAWKVQMKIGKGCVNFHIIKVLFCLISDPDYLQMSEYNQNIMLWSCLFHDIGKGMEPSKFSQMPKARKGPFASV